MHFTDRFIRRPILAIVVSLLILLVGGASLFMLNTREYPNMQSATIVVTTAYPGATQEVMQGFVTTPISQAIATANGIEYLTSTSSQGLSRVSAKLILNANADRSMTEILARVQQVKNRLPPGATDPVINKITDGVAAVQYITFQNPKLNAAQLTDFASRVAEPLFSRWQWDDFFSSAGFELTWHDVSFSRGVRRWFSLRMNGLVKADFCLVGRACA